VTLVELIVVVSIIIILIVAMGFEYNGWMGRYRVESEIKQVYADIMNAKARAMSRSRVHFINMPASAEDRFFVYEDSDENNSLNTATDDEIVGAKLRYKLNPDERNFVIDTHGLIGNGITLLDGEHGIWIHSDLDPDYDCISVSATRVNMGIWNGSICEQK
jgi:type II secretory pathway pseudopilin PulG